VLRLRAINLSTFQLRWNISFGASSAESMNGPGASRGFAAMTEAFGYEVFFPGSDWNPLIVDGKRITALHYDHVFVEIVYMRSGACRLMARPECHLTSVRTLKNISLHAGGGLTGCGNPICRVFHEVREVLHHFSSNRPVSR
jgi:hypothetical protein